MPATTSRLGLQSVIGSDPPSQYRITETANNAILDNAAVVSTGLDAARPTAATTGKMYFATDTNQFSFDTGAAWQTPLMLTPVNVVGGETLAYGTFAVQVAPAITVTLPTPTANDSGALIGVKAGAVSYPNGITINSPVGRWISGGGVYLSATFSLQTTQAATLFLTDGANWHAISGAQNTGWVSLSLAGGCGTLSGDYTPAARLVGDQVQLKGGIQDNNVGAGYMVSATVPSFAVPSATLNFNGASGGLAPFVITSGGSVELYHNSGTASTGLNGFSYYLS